MKPRLRYTCCLLFLLVTGGLRAQVQFAINVDSKEIGRKDELQVDYVISGTDKVSDFHPPYFDKWKIVSGPDFSSISYNVNGKKDQLLKYTYVLTPKNTGDLELPGTSVKVNNKPIGCAPVRISVKRQDHLDGVPPPGSSLAFQGGLTMEDDRSDDAFAKEYVLKPGENPDKKIRSNLFVKAIPSKKKVYVGEPVLVTYRLYTRLKSRSRVIKQPTFTGCSVHEMTTNDALPEKEKINGKLYNSYLIRKVQLVPLQPGEITVGQASVENTVTFIASSSDLRNLYYELETGEEHKITLSTDPFPIEVMPLPKGMVGQAIGNFSIFTKLKKDTSAANETNALIVTIIGAGNFASVAEPEITWPENIYHFDATETDELDKLSFPLSGKRVYEIPFEASAQGNVSIAPVSFSFFNPAKGDVQVVKSIPLRLTVTPAVKTKVQQAVAAADARGTDIRFLLYLVPVVLVAGALLIWRRSGKRVQPALVTIQQNTETSLPVIPGAEERYNALLLVQGDAEFYNKARDFARDMLHAGTGNTDLLLQVLEDCNTMLYTPMPTTSKKEVLDKLFRAIA